MALMGAVSLAGERPGSFLSKDASQKDLWKKYEWFSVVTGPGGRPCDP